MVRGRTKPGQVLVVTVLAIVLLTGLVLLVFNAGEHAARRAETQHAADAAAVSAGIELARSMNTLAANNIATARLLAMVAVMDALPRVAAVSYDEIRAWERAVEAQIDRGPPAMPGYMYRLEPILHQGLVSFRDRFHRQRVDLEALCEAIGPDAYDMAEKTWYRLPDGAGPPPHGQYWRAMGDLDRLSDATAESAGVRAHTQAVHYARANRADAAGLVPVLPQLPVVRGQYTHWYAQRHGPRDTVIRDGRIPDRAVPHRMGPFDRLFRWRRPFYRWTVEDPEFTIPDRSYTATMPIRSVGDCSMIGQSGRAAHRHELIGYTTYGPYGWMRRQLYNYWWSLLRDTNFMQYFDEVSQLKLRYLFENAPTQALHYAHWETNYRRVRDYWYSHGGAELEPEGDDWPEQSITGGPIRQTMLYRIRTVSLVSHEHPAFLLWAPWWSNSRNPETLFIPGWFDPYRHFQVLEHSGRHEWKVGLPESLQPKLPIVGSLLPPLAIHVIDIYFFGGADIGTDVEVANPANWQEGDPLPAPYLMDTLQGDYEPLSPDHDAGVRRRHFSVLAAATRDGTAPAWPARFGHASPMGGPVALAQAEIFNPTSWDLWTQDWQAQLVPVSDLRAWTDRLGAELESHAPLAPGIVDSERLGQVWEFLDRLDPELAETFINH